MDGGFMTTILVIAVATALVSASAQEIEVDFRSDQIDRALFFSDVKGSKGRWLVTSQNGLVAAIPKGPVDRPPIKYTSRFDLEGDFEVVADYVVGVLPAPRVPAGKDVGAASNNIELVISGPGGWATVNRRSTHDGEVWGYYAEVGGRASPSKGWPGEGKAGRLAVRRAGDQLVFLRGIEAGPLEELGAIDFFREPVTEVSLQVNAWNSTDGVEVSFPGVRIKADRIIRRDGGGASPSWLGPARVLCLLAVAAGLAIAVLLWVRRRGAVRAA